MLKYYVCEDTARDSQWIEGIDVEDGDSLPSTRAHVTELACFDHLVYAEAYLERGYIDPSRI